MSVYCFKRVFRYPLITESLGYTLVYNFPYLYTLEQ